MARPKKVKPEAEAPTVEEGVSRGPVTITFTGDPRGGKDPEIAEYGGKSFPKGKPVTVDDANWLSANANILKSNHFKVG